MGVARAGTRYADTTRHPAVTKLLRLELDTLIEEEPEASNVHTAFAKYWLDKLAVSNAAENAITDGPNDRGIDAFSADDGTYHVIQTKFPDENWLDANPDKERSWGRKVVNDAQDAFDYLIRGKEKKTNERVRRLYGLLEADRNREDFSFTYFLVVYGKLEKRGREALRILQETYSESGRTLVLKNLNTIAQEFLVGRTHEADNVDIKLSVVDGKLSSQNYHYFLTSAKDLYTAFRNFGWRLFDLNVRFEIKNSPINGNIVNSLTTKQGRKRFHHLNNGVFIIARNARFSRSDSIVSLSGAQVVNGLQTIKSIYNAVTDQQVKVDELSDCLIQVKLVEVQKDDPIFIAAVVNATNNQNPMSPRNLKSNTKEQKSLVKIFSAESPRWFFQRKQEEWPSLTSENAPFFKAMTGYQRRQFQPKSAGTQSRKGRVIDNQIHAKAWLAFLGFPDWALKRSSDYFTDDTLYQIAFKKAPKDEHWARMSERFGIWDDREASLAEPQAARSQYLLACGIWCYLKAFLPSARSYKVDALNRGAARGKLKKSDGSITSSRLDQDRYLADDREYQVWRLLHNMKEVLVYSTAYLLTKRYGGLEESVCSGLLQDFDLSDFLEAGEELSDLKAKGEKAAAGKELGEACIFGRIFQFLRYVTEQFWEDKRTQLQSTTRLPFYLLRDDVLADFGRILDELEQRKRLDRVWKQEGVTFYGSLPDIGRARL